jgi:hypothetical protein
VLWRTMCHLLLLLQVFLPRKSLSGRSISLINSMGKAVGFIKGIFIDGAA